MHAAFHTVSTFLGGLFAVAFMPIDRDARDLPASVSGEALQFASDVHRTQGRKGTQVPYLAHLLGVTSIALEYGADEDEAIAALLHDAIEDAPGEWGTDAVRSSIHGQFGQRVLEIVEACTDADSTPKPPWRWRKEAYVASIAHKNASALLVGTADKIYNVRAIRTDFRHEGHSVFDRFNPEAGRDGTMWYYGELAVRISSRATELGNSRVLRLAEELNRVVTALRSAVTREEAN